MWRILHWSKRLRLMWDIIVAQVVELPAGRGVLGPFGLIVLADENLSELTSVYFYIAKGVDGGLSTFFCQDGLRQGFVFII